MLIIQASMYRSGSTLMFNILRLILEDAHGVNNVYSSFKEQYTRHNKAPIHLVKIHRRSPHLLERCDKVFCTYRSKEEVLGSMKRRAEFLKGNPDNRFRAETNIDKFDKFWGDLEWWLESDKTITFNYSDMISKLLLTVSEVAQELNVLDRVDVMKVCDQLAAMKPPKEGYDPVTLLHAGHITK